MKSTIKGVYTHSTDGEEYVTKNGNLYIKVLLQTQDAVGIYESFFLTPKAHWKINALFDAAGLSAPSATSVSAADFNELIGQDLEVAVGKNDGGYTCVKKFYPKAKAEDIEVKDNGTDASEEVQDQIDAELLPDDDDDVPF
jgi:hypothetical protein